MKVQVNNKEVEMTPASTLTQLAAQLGLPVQGIAIAVNNKMIPRTEWEKFSLQENDNLVIIKAASVAGLLLPLLRMELPSCVAVSTCIPLRVP